MKYLIVLVIIDAIICAGLASKLAKEKGHPTDTWGVIGFFFGLLGLIAAAGLPKKSLASSEIILKKCPSCADYVPKEALICKFCKCTFPKEKVLSDLVAALESEEYPIDRLVDTILEVADESIVPRIAQFIKKGHNIYRVQKACELLGKIGSASAVPVLIDVLKFEQLRDVSSSALIRIGKPAIDELKKLLSHEKRSIRKAAKKILEQIERRP
jgi:hypothetical protein